MFCLHNSRDAFFRDPYGAAPRGSKVVLRLLIGDAPETRLRSCSVILEYAYGLEKMYYSRQMMTSKYFPGIKNEKLKRDPESCSAVYECLLPLPDEPVQLFYRFRIECEHAAVIVEPESEISSISRRRDADYPDIERERLFEALNKPAIPLMWQITVYDKYFKVPEKAKGAVWYQIFPDRFAYVGEKDRLEYLAEKSGIRADERIFHENWLSVPDYKGKGDAGYRALDFYGGNLQGISKKLDYIKSFASDYIYLNPVFEARSNHRYDTGDYRKIDPVLGDEDDFSQLVIAAAERGIGVVLDGVFSHTGADSKYFNKYGRYDSKGAWQSALEGDVSGYGGWYDIRNRNGKAEYDAWWGFEELPNINEYNLDYRRFIRKNVIEKRICNGVEGFRLDVSDELPDDFIRQIRKSLKKSDPDAVLMGEVWEDASRKISYGARRDFLLGRTHDFVMGYTFRSAIIPYLRNEISPRVFNDELESIRENYPREAFLANMNLISSHDTPRIVTELSGIADPGDRHAQAYSFLNEEQRRLGRSRALLAVAFQTLYQGGMSIYYGDEYAAEGFRDPFNRGPFDEKRAESSNYLKIFRKLVNIRKEYPFLRQGGLLNLYADEDLFAFARTDNSFSGEMLILIINRGCRSQKLNLTVSDLERAHNFAAAGPLFPARDPEREGLMSISMANVCEVFGDSSVTYDALAKGAFNAICHDKSLREDEVELILNIPAYSKLLEDPVLPPYSATIIDSEGDILLQISEGKLINEKLKEPADEPYVCFDGFDCYDEDFEDSLQNQLAVSNIDHYLEYGETRSCECLCDLPAEQPEDLFDEHTERRPAHLPEKPQEPPDKSVQEPPDKSVQDPPDKSVQEPPDKRS